MNPTLVCVTETKATLQGCSSTNGCGPCDDCNPHK